MELLFGDCVNERLSVTYLALPVFCGAPTFITPYFPIWRGSHWAPWWETWASPCRCIFGGYNVQLVRTSWYVTSVDEDVTLPIIEIYWALVAGNLCVGSHRMTGGNVETYPGFACHLFEHVLGDMLSVHSEAHRRTESVDVGYRIRLCSDDHHMIIKAMVFSINFMLTM